MTASNDTERRPSDAECAGLPIARCRSCQAEIVWTLTALGRKMPVDVETNLDGNVLVERVHGERTPRSTVFVPGALKPHDRPGRLQTTSHFSTCPNAHHHRTRRR